MPQTKSHDGQTPLGNAISKLNIFRWEGHKPLEYDPKGYKHSYCMETLKLNWKQNPSHSLWQR